jgi:putative endonuclease
MPFGFFYLFRGKQAVFYVYIIYSPGSDKYYVGQTNDSVARLKHHNAGHSPFTSRYRPWIEVLIITKETRSEALLLEKKLKNLSKIRLKAFIQKYGR